ncbi:hypothetical protein CAEBREN_17574 [Caenorhabditis brenneri]|uniref:Uncharacterized protein n=1 Tax=Caenorhabditis brenneri TaxID=135651 RepID=G0NX45_CAEBE|nr:hypothetical protein CAEBREN_17574 [Caenorhabditis brenneri]
MRQGHVCAFYVSQSPNGTNKDQPNRRAQSSPGHHRTPAQWNNLFSNPLGARAGPSDQRGHPPPRSPSPFAEGAHPAVPEREPEREPARPPQRAQQIDWARPARQEEGGNRWERRGEQDRTGGHWSSSCRQGERPHHRRQESSRAPAHFHRSGDHGRRHQSRNGEGRHSRHQSSPPATPANPMDRENERVPNRSKEESPSESEWYKERSPNRRAQSPPGNHQMPVQWNNLHSNPPGARAGPSDQRARGGQDGASQARVLSRGRSPDSPPPTRSQSLFSSRARAEEKPAEAGGLLEQRAPRGQERRHSRSLSPVARSLSPAATTTISVAICCDSGKGEARRDWRTIGPARGGAAPQRKNKFL